FYRYDAKAQRIVFHYFNSEGGYSEGPVHPAQNELRFPEEQYQQNGKSLVLRTIWRFEGETKLLAVTEQQKDGQWVESWQIAYSRESPRAIIGAPQDHPRKTRPACRSELDAQLGSVRAKRPRCALSRNVARCRRTGPRRAIQRHHHERRGRQRPVPAALHRRLHRARAHRGGEIPGRGERRTTAQDAFCRRRRRMAQVDEPELLRAPGRRLQRNVRGAARSRVRVDARRAERQGHE